MGARLPSKLGHGTPQSRASPFPAVGVRRARARGARRAARTRNVFGYDVEDTAVCTIEHDSGVVGTLISIFNGVRGREERRLEVFFETRVIGFTPDDSPMARQMPFVLGVNFFGASR